MGEEEITKKRNWIYRMFCGHNKTTFVRNIYGDEIIHENWNRSLWRCDYCGKILRSELLHKPLTHVAPDASEV